MVGAARHSGMGFGPSGWYLAPRFIADADVTQYRRHFSDTRGIHARPWVVMERRWGWWHTKIGQVFRTNSRCLRQCGC